MRIISGKFKGKKLGIFKGFSIRPTADKVRESVFNIIRDKVSGASVLDLFAGTGAFGIEALSRGAKRAVFIDNDDYSISLIKKNISACGVGRQSLVIKRDILKNLDCLKNRGFDLISADPPYNKDIIKTAFNNLLKCEVLNPACLVIIEQSFKEKAELQLGCLQLADYRKYGKTAVSFFRINSSTYTSL